MWSKLFKKEFLFGLVIIIILSFIPLLWYKDNQIIAGSDNVFPLQIPNFLRDRLFTWSLNHGLGYDQASVVRSIIVHTIDSVGYFLGTSLQTSQKIAFIFWVFIMLFSAYIFAYALEKWQYIKTPYLKYIFPILYAFNFYTLEAWWIAERIKFSFMVTMPFFLLILIALIRSKKSVLYYALLASVLCTFFNGGGWKGLPLYGGIIVISGIYIIYSIVTVTEKKFYLLTRYIKFFSSFFIFFILFNAWSLFPFFIHTLAQYNTAIASGGPGQVFGWVDMISKDTSFMNLLRFQGIPEWYSNPDHPYANVYLNSPPFILISFLFPALILLSFLFKKEKQEKKFFLYIVLTFLISMFFTAGSHPPLGFLFNFFVLKIPLFAIFRTPIFKFGYAFWFAGGFLISYTVSKIIQFTEEKLSIIVKFKLNYALTILIIVGLIIYHFPFLTGNFFSWSRGQLENRVVVPSYVYQVTNWADKKNDSYRIFLLPRANPNWTGDTYTWKFFSLYPLTAFISRQPFLYNNDSLTSDETALVNGLYDAILSKDVNKIAEYSRLLKTKYFIVRNDYFSSLYWTPTESPEQYTNAIRSNNQFVYVKSYGKWDIYQISTAISEDHAQVSTDIVSYSEGNFIQVPGLIAAIDNNVANKVFIPNNVSKTYVGAVNFSNDNVLSYPCITCEITLRDNSITFPRIWVYPDSPLYKIKGIIKSKMSHLTGETQLLDELGHTLISTQQIVDMFNYTGDKKESKDAAIVVSFTELNNLYGQIDKWIINNYVSNQAQIYYTPEIMNYIDTEEEGIAKNLSSTLDTSQLENKPYYFMYINYLSIYKSLHDKLINYEKGTNYLSDKIYYPTVTGDYSSFLLYHNDQIAGVFKDAPLSINNTLLMPISQRDNYVQYDSYKFLNNDKVVQSAKNVNLIQNVHEEKSNIPLELGANSCVGQDIGHVMQGDAFAISLSYLNDFNNNLQFAIYTKDKVDNSPVLYSKNIAQNKNKLSKQIPFVAQKNYNDIFIGFCADDITIYTYDIKLHLEMYQIFSPSLALYQKGNESNLKLPTIKVNRVNQTKYIITITDAENPFFLTFFEQFDSDWKAYIKAGTHSRNYGSTGDVILERGIFDTWFSKPIPAINHFTANGYMNGWFINKTGSYSIIIEYQPQKLFYQGIIVSLVGVIGVICFIFVRKIKK